MGARPLRRAIQRFIEDPLADEVLRAGAVVPGTTVVVDKDGAAEDEERPLKLTLRKPRKRAAPKKAKEPKEPVGVGAKKSEGDSEPESDAPTPDEPAPSSDEG
jgi:ATP-dependent Clp protease ATP-binding subunit ClpC